MSCLASWAWVLAGLADRFMGLVLLWPRLVLLSGLFFAMVLAWGYVWGHPRGKEARRSPRWGWLGGAQLAMGALAAVLLFVDVNEDPCPGYDEGNDVCYVSSFEPVPSTVVVVVAFVAVNGVSVWLSAHAWMAGPTVTRSGAERGRE